MDSVVRRQIPPPSFWAGIFIVLLGVALLLDRMDILNIGRVLRYWPAILILIGGGKFVQGPSRKERVWGGIVFGAGVVLLLNRLGVSNVRVFDLWPLLVIAAGVLMLWESLSPGGSPRFDNVVGGSVLNQWTVFGGAKLNSSAKRFQGGELLACCGGYDVDLRHAEIDGPEAVIRLYAVFGGMELKVPEHWHIVIRVTPIFGGYEDKTLGRRSMDPTVPSKVLVVEGLVVFGGFEVKH